MEMSTGVRPEGRLATGARVTPIPPPLYYVAAVAGGMMLHRSMPLEVPGGRTTSLLGGLVVAAGLGLNFAGIAGVARHHTTIVPHRPVAELVTTGAFGVSRNPMYTGLAIATAGAGLLARSWWPLLLLPAALLAIRTLVIAPEERYLAERFGADYTRYQGRVRRWL